MGAKKVRPTRREGHGIMRLPAAAAAAAAAKQAPLPRQPQPRPPPGLLPARVVALRDLPQERLACIWFPCVCRHDRDVSRPHATPPSVCLQAHLLSASIDRSASTKSTLSASSSIVCSLEAVRASSACCRLPCGATSTSVVLRSREGGRQGCVWGGRTQRRVRGAAACAGRQGGQAGSARGRR